MQPAVYPNWVCTVIRLNERWRSHSGLTSVYTHALRCRLGVHCSDSCRHSGTRALTVSVLLDSGVCLVGMRTGLVKVGAQLLLLRVERSLVARGVRMLLLCLRQALLVLLHLPAWQSEAV